MLIKFKYYFYKYLPSMMFQIITLCFVFFFRKELGKAKKMKENVSKSKDKLSKITNSQSIEVNNIYCLFLNMYLYI